MRSRTGSLFCTRCGSSAASCRCLLHFPPRARLALHEAVLNEILEERVVSSRGRRVPRGVKRKMSNYPLRPRASQPIIRIDFTTAIKIENEQYCPKTGCVRRPDALPSDDRQQRADAAVAQPQPAPQRDA